MLKIKCVSQLFICVSYLNAINFVRVLLKRIQFSCIMHKLSELLRETACSVHELRNSIRNATNRRYDHVYRRIYLPSLDAGLDIRPYFVDPGSGLPESI